MSAPRGLFAAPRPVRLARMAIGLVFVVAAIGKLADLPAFALQVHNYRMTPAAAENLIAIALPPIELVAGFALVIGVRARAGAVVALALMALFTVVVGVAWARGLDFECGCFGKAGAAHIGASKFFENVGLSLLAAFAARRLPG